MGALGERPPELVIFDIDGTLNGVEMWWPELLRSGLREFAAKTGLAIPAPDDAAALAVVGSQEREVWRPFLAPADQHRWEELRAEILPQEVALLSSGRDYLYPGIRELLAELRARGVKLALASNCSAAYLRAQIEGQGLGALTDWQFCLASPGVQTKADMLERALWAAGTRRAVMVGDRDSDQEAAAAVGLPFIWRRNPLCAPAADACWDGSVDGLLTLLGLGRISLPGSE